MSTELPRWRAIVRGVAYGLLTPDALRRLPPYCATPGCTSRVERRGEVCAWCQEDGWAEKQVSNTTEGLRV